jgi:hypothetical protein
MCNILNWPCILTAVTSGCSNFTCFHASVKRLALMRITDLVLSGYSSCVLGYIVVQFQLACVFPLKSMYGSCIAHMSYMFHSSHSSRSCWLSRDLLMFCCHICIGLWDCSCSWFSHIFKGHGFSVLWQPHCSHPWFCVFKLFVWVLVSPWCVLSFWILLPLLTICLCGIDKVF